MFRLHLVNSIVVQHLRFRESHSPAQMVRWLVLALAATARADGRGRIFPQLCGWEIE